MHRLHAAGRHIASLVPGHRPQWVVVELSGSYPARIRRKPWFGLPLPAELGLSEPSLEELGRELESLGDAPWLEGVLLRIHDLRVDMATAYALRRAIAALRHTGKRTVAWLSELDHHSYYVAAAAETVVAPPSAELRLFGFGASVTFLRDALDKLGVRFEKLAIAEYKDAFDGLVRQTMSDGQREQLGALLDSIERQFAGDVAGDRRLGADDVRRAIAEGVSSAERARELGLLDRVAYEDELLGAEHRTLPEVERFLRVRSRPIGEKRVAVVTVQGLLVTGRSRRSPLALPAIGSMMAGADSIIQCLRAATDDEQTAAIVLYVNSGGGSALASDLLWHEVRRVGLRKPVVAVFGGVAASGGYYLAAGARRIVAAPGTITGSIGVVTGKLVLGELYRRWGLNSEQLKRGRFALLSHPARPLDDEERALLQRSSEEAYRRFVSCVAEGRGVSRERVNELGRGRIWSGADALGCGLVDELGDAERGIELAAELAGLPREAASWNVRAPAELLLPSPEDPSTLGRAFGTLLRERTLAIHPALVSVE